MKHPLGNQPFRSLPAIFSEQGFATLFLYNGLFSWDNKEGFLRAHAAQRLIGRADYVNPSFVDPDWGVADHDVFGRAVQEFDQLAQAGKRFCGVIITLSNHAPFTLPQVGLTPITVGGTERQRLNGVQYADWAIGQFMAQARSRPWFEETLFVFVGDHGFGIPPVLTQVNLLHEHVPLLFYGPGVLGARPEVRHQVASQLDVLPSILGLFEFRAVHQSFGRDLFSLPATDPGHAYVRQSGDPVIGFIQGDELVTTSIGQAARYHQYRLGFPPSTTEDQAAQQPARTRELERQLQAFVVTGLMTLEQHRAAPETRSGPAPVLATGR